ncbi:ATP-binding cassette domain-containing protein [Amygdalobacter indicium]|uniref:metal ABC transporter ATP-binding protein n=1 Tax=Amygdalobacter indicium TaxID=3029272 RepID=UPI0027A7D354|nr:ATP-binding cassette domain-containing protein [Amygdalobacter indicium]WEG34047.1 ATP-binding cassette domain-containing protein [Amygdalobacter indicium]
MVPVISAEKIDFAYESKTVLKQLCLTVKKGELLTIIGANGSGKSTLLNLLLGNLSPQSGTIELFGDDICQDRHYRDLAYISQNSFSSYRNFPTTVKEALKIHLAYLHKKVDLQPYLQQVDLVEQANLQLSQLSGGQLQKVALMLALVKEAKLIILDEPTAAIDRCFAKSLMQKLKELTLQGCTVLLVTHNLTDVLEYTDRVLRLKNGSLQEVALAKAQNVEESDL